MSKFILQNHIYNILSQFSNHLTIVQRLFYRCLTIAQRLFNLFTFYVIILNRVSYLL